MDAVLPYRSKELKGGYLVTNDFGSWALLSEREFSSLSREKIGRKLREKLLRAGIIINRGNRERVIKNYRMLNRFLFQGPSLHIVVPTLECNQRCVYCQAASPGAKGHPEMNRETAKRIVSFIFRSPSPWIGIEFQGGEPLLNWETVRFIVAEARRLNRRFKRNLKLSMVSNLTLMDEEKLGFLIKNRVSLCTSLDGPKHVHDRNRKYSGGSGSYDDVVYWIDRITREYRKRKSPLRLNALPTITRHSLPHWKGITDEYVRLGFNTIHLRFLNRMGMADKNWREIRYEPEEFVDFWKKSLDHIIGLNRGGLSFRERMASIMLVKILDKEDPGYTELMSPCGAGMSQLLYNHNGNVYSCDEARMLGEDLFRLGNVRRDSYESVMGSETLLNIRCSSVLDNYCQHCVYKPYCGTCPVINYAEHGNPVPRITETTMCRIYKEQFTYIFNKISRDSRAGKIFRKWVVDAG